MEGERLTSKFHPKLLQTFLIDVFLVLCKLHVSFSAASFESSAFHLDLPVAEQTKEKISDSNPPMTLHPTARFHWSLLYPNPVKEGPLKDSILFHTLSQYLNSSTLLVFSHRSLPNRHRQLQSHKFLSPRDTSSLRSAGREAADSSLSAPVSPVPVCTHWLICKRLQSRRLYPCQLTRRFKRLLTLCWPADSIYKSFIFPTGSQLLRRSIRLQ